MRTTVASFRDLPAAELARSRLEADGIDVVLQNAHLVGVQWLYSHALGGVELQVAQSEAVRARELLSRDRAGDLDNTPEAVAVSDELCPRCSSPRAFQSRLERRTKAVSMLIGVPFVLWRRHATCESCGHSWRPPSHAD